MSKLASWMFKVLGGREAVNLAESSEVTSWL